jgi:hypothetical protein
MDFEFTVSQDGAVTLDGVPVEEAQEASPPSDAAPPGDDELRQLRRERDQFREKAELYETFEPMIRAVGRGEVEIPAPPVTPEAVVGYRRRLSTPGSAEILQLVRDYAETLPEEQKEVLDNNHAAFNEVFDKIASLNPPPPPRVSRRMAERTLRHHEQLVDAGRSLRSGVLPEAMSDDPLKWKAAEVLKKRIRAGDRDSEISLAKIFLGNDG